MKTNILLIDDEPAFCELCALLLEQAGFHVEFAHDIDSGLALFQQAKEDSSGFDLVLHDLALPPSFKPEDSLEKIHCYKDVPVIVLTAHSDRSYALKAIEQGAWDFIPKPIDPDLLIIIIQRALEKNSLLLQIKNLETTLESTLDNALETQSMPNFGLIGRSNTLQSTRELIQRISNTQVPVLIQGPSGTGKEIIAKAIHNHSDRKQHNLISVHCGAIPAELLESELFGYKKGAFTGADSDRKGLLASADKGTLFLDEIGEMPISMQVKLLRVLQDGSYYPVGSRQLATLNARLICATNRDLSKEISSGNFREDLYYRIKGLTISTTSLVNRKEDIPVLVDYFLALYNHEHKTDISLDKETCTWFLNNPWPGNVRELKNTLESAAAICLGNHLGLQEIELIRGERPRLYQDNLPADRTLEEHVIELEISLIKKAMIDNQGNKTHTAQALGITRQGLINKIKRYQLS